MKWLLLAVMVVLLVISAERNRIETSGTAPTTVTINRTVPTAGDCYDVRTYEACYADAPHCALTAKQLDDYLRDQDDCSKLFVFPNKP